MVTLGEIANTFLLVYAGLFPIVNPVGSAPVFLSLTRRYAAETRHLLAGRIAINGFFMLLASLFVGSHILDFFGITLPIVRLAGGCVVVAVGWQLLREGVSTDQQQAEMTGEPAGLDEAFYPLTMPLTVGPGSIATAIALGSQRPLGASSAAHLAMLAGGAIAALAAMGVTIYVAYRFAEGIERVLGPSGTNVLVRLSAFILLCIGFEIAWSGVSSLFGLPLAGAGNPSPG
jgi:multiple antibiotic resistance protein